MMQTNYVAERIVRLRRAMVAGCTCGTKSPLPLWHDESCTYRLHVETEAELSMLAAMDDLWRTMQPILTKLLAEAGSESDRDTYKAAIATLADRVSDVRLLLGGVDTPLTASHE